MDRVFSFLLWPKREARGPWKQGRKKRGSITCRTDRANEANKMFIIWLCWLFRFWKGDRELEVRTATYGPGIDQSQHAKSVSHIRLIRCLLYNCFLLTFIKSLLFFIHAKIARCCLICWNSLRFHTARKPVRSFVTLIGCWTRASPHFPAFFGRARTYMQTLLRLSLLIKWTIQLNCVWPCIKRL